MNKISEEILDSVKYDVSVLESLSEIEYGLLADIPPLDMKFKDEILRQIDYIITLHHILKNNIVKLKTVLDFLEIDE